MCAPTAAAREHRQYLFSLWPARANDGESRQSSVERHDLPIWCATASLLQL
ncbi:hypothetical protein WJX75_004505 [Coccomyxa subellipsoidea]|uniref:Uncharacterized protein n=1 Tax=Coccomyxa subellipsoidea TaxID=248742 RepID=A0ABR2YXF9_9CHLO